VVLGRGEPRLPTRGTHRTLGNGRLGGQVRQGMVDGSPDEWRDDRNLRELLTAKQVDVLAQVGALSRSMEDIVGASESANGDDEHDPEGSTIAFERAQVAALLAQARAHLTEVTGALQRLDAGGYGCCERCGAAIPQERLLARPTARTCIHCAVARHG
jgi:DnaK suppressor protein